MRTVEITIKGKVQGVFFRKHTKEKADELGVKGFVMNKDDGTVYAVAQADSQTLQKFKEWCQEGPTRANVTEVSEKIVASDDYDDFEIKW